MIYFFYKVSDTYNKEEKRTKHMLFDEKVQSGFAYEMMETMVSATEIFNTVLLNNLKKYFCIYNAYITVFDFEGKFLSLTDLNRLYIGTEHPYFSIAEKDICARKINEECRKDNMWHDNIRPYIYRTSDLLLQDDGETTEYVHFLNETMHVKYQVIMPFDIYGCIHLCIYRGEGEQDFSDRELEYFEQIYKYIAKTFKLFKVLEKPKIISNIKDEVILIKEDAYIITDIDHKVLTSNQKAREYISAMTGSAVTDEKLKGEESLILFILQGASGQLVKTVEINGYIFQVYPFPMNYVHGMVEMYHWINIHRAEDQEAIRSVVNPLTLTKREKEVAELLCEGLSYQAIADEIFISFHTVKNHVQNIFSKYNVNNRYQFYQIYKTHNPI